MNKYKLFYKISDLESCGYYLTAFKVDDHNMWEFVNENPEYEYVTTIEIEEPGKEFVVTGMVADIDKKLAELELKASQLREKKQQVLALEAL